MFNWSNPEVYVWNGPVLSQNKTQQITKCEHSSAASASLRCHGIETIPYYLSPVDSSHKGPAVRSFGVLCTVRRNKQWNKHSCCRCVKVPWRSYDVTMTPLYLWTNLKWSRHLLGKLPPLLVGVVSLSQTVGKRIHLPVCVQYQIHNPGTGSLHARLRISKQPCYGLRPVLTKYEKVLLSIFKLTIFFHINNFSVAPKKGNVKWLAIFSSHNLFYFRVINARKTMCALQ